MDYDETIQSIAYAFLDDVDYKQRTEEEDEEFEFYEWWDEINGYEQLAPIVDSYVAGSWRSQMEIILASPTDPDQADSGLWESSTDWKQTVGCIAFELLRVDATEWISDHVNKNGPMFESGGVLPETNERQIWLGKEAPLFIIEAENPIDAFESMEVHVAETKNSITLDSFGPVVLCLEGKPEKADPRDLKELTMGGRSAIRPRRLYTQSKALSKDPLPAVQGILALALRKGWVSIPDYERYKALLPQLSVD